MAVWIFLNKHVIVLIGKWRYKFIALLELAPWYVTGNPYGALVTIAPSGKEKCFPIPCPCPCPCLCLCPCPSPCSVSVSVSFSVSLSVSVNVSVSTKYGATNIFVRRGNYSVNFQGPYEVAWKIKRPLNWEGMEEISWKSRRLYLKERPISRTNLAGESL